MSYAGFWRRAAASLLDFLLLALLCAAMVAIEVEAGLILHAPAGGVYGAILAWLYFAGMESSREQATLGKMALGLRVSDTEGRRISFLRASGRQAAKVVSALALLLGFIMVAWSPRRQGLHDRLVGTLVLLAVPQPARGQPVPARAEPAAAPLPDGRQAGREAPALALAPAAHASASELRAHSPARELEVAQTSSSSLKA